MQIAGKKIGIYKITNPNGKIYIGQSIDIERRYTQHKNPKESKRQKILHRSLAKYGVENHIFEIIEECSVDCLDERELYWGEYYNVLNGKGLNCRLGKGRGVVSEELRERMKISNKGKKLKSILQYDLHGNFIKEWSSLFEAEMNFSKTNHSNISACCLGKQKTAWGYIWRFRKGQVKNKIQGVKTGHPIKQYTLEEKFVKEWKNVKQICNELKFSYSTIYECLKGKYKTSNGFIWKYK